tara:strand:+ start:2914 stop:3519 length:606 start_codon:yes stop_codon:yes gene_type:complete
MLYFAHRINSINELKFIPKEIGVEIDIRDQGADLVLSHDPFHKDLPPINDYLKLVEGRPLIANIKSERIENRFYKMLQKFSPHSDYFFLDSSLNVMALNKGKFNFASRFSEFESLETSIKMIKKSLVNWLWIDTFTQLPINKKNISILNNLKIKKCLTSPDLLGRDYEIMQYAESIRKMNFKLDAICCKYKNIKIWEKFLS